MKKRSIRMIGGAAGVLVAAPFLFAPPGCASEGKTAGLGSETTPDLVMQAEEVAALPGARLWAENCIRCHNFRKPASLSDRQWKTVLHHMRVRANLTADEHAAILQFLQAAN